MPLHLLGKKSWNVYNVDNVERVRRDEAAAQAAQEAEDQRTQDEDAARRLAILRGESPPPISEPLKTGAGDRTSQALAIGDRVDSQGHDARPRKKRKRFGEDDTDFEMRVARENARDGDRAASLVKRPEPATTDIVDKRGNISLVGPAPPSKSSKQDKNPEAERERAQKEREMEDQYTMRFSNAAGRDGFSTGSPWYAKVTQGGFDNGVAPAASQGLPTKNVFGKDDPFRRDRDAARISTGDPLAMMKMGAKKVREMQAQRLADADERDRDLKALEKEERRREKRRRREGREESTHDSVRDESSSSRHISSRHESSRHDRHGQSDFDVRSRHRAEDRRPRP